MSDVWSKIKSILGGNNQHYAGRSVAISGDGQVVAVGQDINNQNLDKGPVYIYKRSGDSWVQIGNGLQGAERSKFGHSLSISKNGEILAIGAPSEGTGKVYIYKLVNSNWQQIGSAISGEKSGDEFGFSVSISDDGNIVAIGARFSDQNGTNAGSVKIYRNNGGSWSQYGGTIKGDKQFDYSGKSVSLSSDGSTVAIGANGGSHGGNNHQEGKVKIFNIENNTWKLKGEIIGESANDEAGFSVSLSSDGSIVAIGEPGDD